MVTDFSVQKATAEQSTSQTLHVAALKDISEALYADIQRRPPAAFVKLWFLSRRFPLHFSYQATWLHI